MCNLICSLILFSDCNLCISICILFMQPVFGRSGNVLRLFLPHNRDSTARAGTNMLCQVPWRRVIEWRPPVASIHDVECPTIPFKAYRRSQFQGLNLPEFHDSGPKVSGSIPANPWKKMAHFYSNLWKQTHGP
ncbi:hypothetical protein BDN72DRAFT_102460 [Pluteus cervinus]|uniref:Uncharacterized protein n=1 Tax=Pluteus cervinus TaxID=181527 RepID=A0ACD3B998_9AGAR|nr:hypothetical protein BDN72DRAFT_102460 [Pluteus cervinus]